MCALYELPIKTMAKHVLHNEVMTRDNWTCRVCGSRDRDALQTDHVMPRSLGGSDRLENLQALCGVCNNRKMQIDLLVEPVIMSDEESRAWEIVNAGMATRRKSFDIQLEEAKQDKLDSLIRALSECPTKQTRINFLDKLSDTMRRTVREGEKKLQEN